MQIKDKYNVPSTGGKAKDFIKRLKDSASRTEVLRNLHSDLDDLSFLKKMSETFKGVAILMRGVKVEEIVKDVEDFYMVDALTSTSRGVIEMSNENDITPPTEKERDLAHRISLIKVLQKEGGSDILKRGNLPEKDLEYIKQFEGANKDRLNEELENLRDNLYLPSLDV